MTGHFAYYAVPTNSRALSAFRHHVTDLWRRTLRRRSQKDGFTWDRMTGEGQSETCASRSASKTGWPKPKPTMDSTIARLFARAARKALQRDAPAPKPKKSRRSRKPARRSAWRPAQSREAYFAKSRRSWTASLTKPGPQAIRSMLRGSRSTAAALILVRTGSPRIALPCIFRAC